jgi:hypothetical protein
MSMDYIQVELKKYKFMAYLFDGKEESAREFCRKWGCNYVEDFMDKSLTSLVFPDGKKCYAGNYVVIDGDRFTAYTKEEFIKTFTIIPNYRQGNYTFMSED